MHYIACLTVVHCYNTIYINKIVCLSFITEYKFKLKNFVIVIKVINNLKSYIISKPIQISICIAKTIQYVIFYVK